MDAFLNWIKPAGLFFSSPDQTDEDLYIVEVD